MQQQVFARIPRVLAIQSHVVFGHAGNAAAEFPMRRLGINVLPLNTVQYSNHTQYPEKWTGIILPPGHITSIAQGIANIGELHTVDAVLSGFLGSENQAQEVLDVVEMVKKANPNAVYLCDPVMGNEEKGCIVPKEVTNFIANRMVGNCHLLCPNQLELNTFLGRTPKTFNDCVDMALELYTKSQTSGTPCQALLIKNLTYPQKNKGQFEMLLVQQSPTNGSVEVYLTQRPLFDFAKSPVGVGDLTSGIFLSRILLGDNNIDAMEFTTSAVHHVMEQTYQRSSYELELIAAQDLIASPQKKYAAKKVL